MSGPNTHIATRLAALTVAAIAQLHDPVTAQHSYVPSDTPKLGVCNPVPFGTTAASSFWKNQKYQQMVMASELPNYRVGTICNLGFSPCGTGIRHFDSIEVVFGQTMASTLASTFASNLATNVQTVLKATPYDWHHRSHEWNDIGLDVPYRWDSAQGNLVIQITVTGSDYPDTGHGFHREDRPRVYAAGWATSPPAVGIVQNSAALKVRVGMTMGSIGVYGVGCQGSNGIPELSMTGEGKFDTAMFIALDDGARNAPFLLGFGGLRHEPRQDLTANGAPGCYLYTPITHFLTGSTNGAGEVGFAFVIPPDPSLFCVAIYAQFLCADQGANAANLTTSNYGRVRVGL